MNFDGIVIIILRGNKCNFFGFIFENRAADVKYVITDDNTRYGQNKCPCLTGPKIPYCSGNSPPILTRFLLIITPHMSFVFFFNIVVCCKIKRVRLHEKKIRKLIKKYFAFANRKPYRIVVSDNNRDVAQPGSAFAWGASGRWFESSHPDQSAVSDCVPQ